MKHYLIILSAILVFPVLAFGQEKLTDKARINELKSAAEDTANKNKQLFTGNNFTPFGSGSLSNLLSNASVSSVLNNGENAKVEFKYTSQKWLTFGLSADQKIGKGDKKATPFDLMDGISPGTTIEFNLQSIFWEPVLSKENFAHFDSAATQFSQRTGVNRRGVTRGDIISNGDSQEISQLQRIKLRQPIFFNIKASITKNSFSYATDPNTLKEIKETHLDPMFGAFLGIPFSLKSFLSIGYIFSQSYENADEITFNSPFGSSSNTYSRTLIFGNPSKTKDNKINMEWRMNFGKEGSPVSFGVAPSIIYGLTSKKIATYLPLYFINGKDAKGKPNGLQGGVRFGYSTSTKKGEGNSFKEGFGAQLIITAPFNVFSNL